jgi:2,3-diketo-5-methylthio-1-phosphopentane phosphatase
MPPAQRTPSFAPGDAPLSLLVDFDGTISRLDVGDELLRRYAEDQAAVARLDAFYDEGRVGSRDLMRWDMEVLPRDAELLRREALAIELDPTFGELVATARRSRVALEIVSDGFGFHVEPMLAAAGFRDLPVATNVNRLGEGGAGLSFPYGHPACFVCGTCKRERVRAHQAAGHRVAFVGDGTSDRYAANHADVVFARDKLASACRESGIAYLPWQRLADVAAWLRSASDDGGLTTFGEPDRRGAEGPSQRGFICGPEAWGPGRSVPPMPLDRAGGVARQP